MDCWQSLCASVGMQLSILLFLIDKAFLACILLSISSFWMTWQWATTEQERGATYRHRGHAKLWLILLLAVFVISLALLVWLRDGWMDARSHGLFGGDGGLHTHSAHLLKSSGEQVRSSYVGIVLWPPPKKKTEIVPPPSHMHSMWVWNTSKPLVIPFDGPYWYFKAPDKQPSPKARIVHGIPTRVDIHSTDWHPLLMEAHQNLGSSINLDCCQEMDLTITNADNRPGRIAIGVMLTDSTSPDKPSQYLGEKSIVSSEAPHFSMNRSPIEETLRFQIPSGKIRRFDGITVVFLSAKERALGGAKVSIQQFTLIPR